jgi:aspartate kinase
LAVLELLQSQPFINAIRDLKYQHQVAKVSIVGLGIKSHPEVLAMALDALAYENIYPMLMTTAEIKASVLVTETQLQQALQCLHVIFLT